MPLDIFGCHRHVDAGNLCVVMVVVMMTQVVEVTESRSGEPPGNYRVKFKPIPMHVSLHVSSHGGWVSIDARDGSNLLAVRCLLVARPSSGISYL